MQNDFNGIVNVFKEQDFTSHDVVAKMRGIYGQKKIGHTGTLDPMAEGVLIVCLGQATKLADILISKNKTYVAKMKLGFTSNTDDTTGEMVPVISEEELDGFFAGKPLTNEQHSGDIKSQIQEVFQSFLGDSMQIPPMYSAIKVNGKKLYEYARAGITIEREPRPISIYKLELKDIDAVNHEISFEVECSKGTYIRALIRDMGEKLGTGAVMSGLLRNEVNGIYAENGYRLSDLQALKEEGRLGESLLPMDELLKSFPRVSINESGLKYLQNGNRLIYSNFEDDEHLKHWSDKLENAEFIRIYVADELKALYTFDKEKNDYKVFKML